MADILTKLKFRQGTIAAWTGANPVLAAGEPGLETDTKIMRVGDGVTAFLALPRIGNMTELTAQVALANAAAAAAAVSAASIIPAFLQRICIPTPISGTATAIVLTTGGSLAVLTTGMQVDFIATTAPTGPVTIALDGTGVKAAQTLAGAAIPANHWIAGQRITGTYDGVAWRLEPEGLYGRVAAVIEDRKSPGNNGGTFNSGAPRTRTFNTLVQNDGGLVALAGNRFTIQPGKYICEWRAPAFGVSIHQSSLFNVTTANYLISGSLSVTSSGVINDGASSRSNDSQSESIGLHQFAIIAASQFEIRHECSLSQSSTGFGISGAFFGANTPEVFTHVKITPLKP